MKDMSAVYKIEGNHYDCLNSRCGIHLFISINDN